MKRLSVVVAGTGQIRDVEIQPGTTAGDILNQLSLKDYLLSKGPNDPFFAAAESVYDKVNDGEKIFASTKAEVGELPLAAQVKLLRALQEGMVEAVGGRKPVKVDVRIISATNRKLLDLVKNGSFGPLDSR